MFSLCKYHLHYQYILSSIECCVCVCFRVVYTVLFDSWEIIGPYRAWWLLNGLLLVLQALHIIWFYLIARIAIKAILRGKVSPRHVLVLDCDGISFLYQISDTFLATVCSLWHNMVAFLWVELLLSKF